MSGDYLLCDHGKAEGTCEECKAEGAEFRRRVQAGEIECPICGKMASTQPCGHPALCIVSSDEGTNYCGWCADLGEIERLKKMVRIAHQCGYGSRGRGWAEVTGWKKFITMDYPELRQAAKVKNVRLRKRCRYLELKEEVRCREREEEAGE